MFKLVIYTCVALLIGHFILYYCNVDAFQFFKTNSNTISNTVIQKNISIDEKKEMDKTITGTLKESLETCLNELKTLEDTIENGCIDTEFSSNTTPLF
jgi:hypothetical protein